jgi:hypothetical protein
MNIALMIGIAGAALVLLAYILSEMKVWSEESLRFDIVNAAGSALLIAYALLLNSIPFMILNGAWLLLSVRDGVRDICSAAARKK